MANSSLFSLLLANSLSHIAVINSEGSIIYVNDAWVNFAKNNGGRQLVWEGVNYINVCEVAAKNGDLTASVIVNGIHKLQKGNSNSNSNSHFYLEYPCHSPNEHRWFLMRVIPLSIDQKDCYAIFHDRFMSDTELRMSQERLALATEVGEIGVWEYDLVNNSLVWDNWMHKMYGTDPANFSVNIDKWRQMLHPHDEKAVIREIQKTLYRESFLKIEFRILTHDYKQRYILAKGQSYSDKKGRITKIIGVNVDITDRLESEKRIRNLAYFDQLTGLPNRTLFSDRVDQAIRASNRQGGAGAILFIDLDQFKKVNDTAGHNTGDCLLKAVAQRFSAFLREEDTLCRAGGDEFIVLATGLNYNQSHAINGAKALAKKLLNCLKEPFLLNNYTAQVSASIGVSLFFGNSIKYNDLHENDEENYTLELLLKQADIAMYKAKSSGRNRVCFFDPSLQSAVDRKALVEQELTKSLTSGSLSLFYQPQLHDKKGVVGAEVLLRWFHKTLGEISPVEFIPIAEENGLIVDIGDWVLDKVCSQIFLWREDPLLKSLQISINISAKQLHANDFVEKIIRCIKHYKINPKLLKLELTESILLEDIDVVVEKMHELEKANIHFTLDDFGTGYSCLSYLKLLPLSVIKIDKSFVKGITLNKHDASITRTIMALANTLELDVIAEGVEEKEQLKSLQEMGCHIFQGFYYSKAIDLNSFEAYVNKIK